MNISGEDIAKLVLGYLKVEKCKSAAKSFVKSSKHLRDIPGSVRRSKHFITRVYGYCLTEIIHEYAQLYTIILEYLEETPYSNDECTSRDMPGKLIYLLENANRAQSVTPSLSPRSRSSTPIKQFSSVTVKLKRGLAHNLSVIEETSCTTAYNVNTTLLHELPGNTSNDIGNGSGRKKHLDKEGKEDESDITDNIEDKENNEESIAKVLAETILENRELQEKLAENINAVIQKPSDENVGCSISESIVNNELNTAIKAIVHKTEHDPVFERLLNDLIGPNESESGPDDPQTPQISTKEQHHTETACADLTNEKATTEITKSNPEPKKQIITIDGTKVDSTVAKQNLTVNTDAGDLILYDGTLENFMKEPSNSLSATASVNSNCSSNVILNTGLLMVQPPAIPQPQSYYMWNGSQIVNVSVPQYKVNSLSEQDILTMPTVIVCEENQQSGVVPVVNSSERTPKPLKKIAPKLPKAKSAKKKKSRKATQKTTASQNVQTIQIKVLPQDEVGIKPNEVSSSLPPKINPETTKNTDNNSENNTEGVIKIESSDPTPPTQEGEAQVNRDRSKDKLDVVEHKFEVAEEPKSKKSPKQSTPKTKPSSSQKGGTSTPKSRSHVRALDFNFGTPSQNATTSPRKKSPGTKGQQGKISKSLFATPSKNQRKSTEPDKKEKGGSKSWDSDLRALAAGTSKSPPPKKKKPTKRKPKKKESSLNKTEQDAKAIEEHLKSNEEIHVEENPEKTTEVENEKPAGDCIEIVVQKETEEANFNEEHDLPFTLVNCNHAPRINRKCNIDGNLKKEVKVTKVKEVKNLDVCSNKMILSPSKLNANKRTLVENKVEDNKVVENKVNESKVPLTPSFYDRGSFGENELLTLNFEKNITPENIKVVNYDSSALKASRNLISFMETPMKSDFLGIPKTPNIISPINTKDTPLTKIFKEHLEGVDLTAIQTPNLTITPFNNVTYENRPTDYSTSSSYYQPSDTEQNKSIEQLIEDSKKVDTTENAIKKNKLEKSEQCVESSTMTSIVSKLTSFNRSIIGKKNLSLVSKTDTISFGDSDSENDNFSGSGNLTVAEGKDDETYRGTSDETTDESETSVNSWDSKNSRNVTVIQRQTESRYPLRSRNKVEEKVEDVESKENSDEVQIAPVIDTKEVDTTKERTSHCNKKELILLELERKRQETIALMKQPISATKQKNDKKQGSAAKQSKQSNTTKGLGATKQLTAKQSNVARQHKSVKQKLKLSPKKRPSKSVTKNDSKKKLTKIDENLHNDNFDVITPINLVEAQLECSTSSNPKETKELESKEECLIRNLKERGIYLLPNKKKVQLDPPDDNSSTELLSTNTLPLKKRENKLVEVKETVEIMEVGGKEVGKVESEEVEKVESEEVEKVESEKVEKVGSEQDVIVERKIVNKEGGDSLLHKKDLPLFKELSALPKEDSSLLKEQLKEKTKCTTLQEDLNLTDSFTEETLQFDFKSKSEFDDIFVHDPAELAQKKLPDYDLERIKKTFNANVFVDELNKVIVRVLAVSPMDFVLDISPTDKVNIINIVTLKKSKPLETHNTQLVKSNSIGEEFQTKSPLLNLYEDQPQKGVEKGKSSRRRKSVEGTKKPQVLPTRKSSRSLSIDEQKIKAKNLKSVKPVDLMDFAIVGDKQSPSTSPMGDYNTKRKATEEIASEKSKCPKLCENLLSGLNVDHFLAQIHKK